MNQIETIIKKTVVPRQHNNKNYFCPWDVAEFLYPQLKEFSTWPDMETATNYLVEALLGHHIISFRNYYFDWIEKIYNAIKNNEEMNFGDLDYCIEIILDNDKKKVFVLIDSCTCVDINKWIIIWDNDKFESKIHVRELYDKGDYPKKQYPSKLNLKFYQNREFIIDYVKKYHFANLGGVYGDIRDKGYIISYKKYHGVFEKLNNKRIEDLDHLFHFYSAWKNFTFRLKIIESELDSRKNKCT